MASRLTPRASRLVGALALAAATNAAFAADISVISVGAVKSAFVDATVAWEKSTGNKVTASYTTTPGGSSSSPWSAARYPPCASLSF